VTPNRLSARAAAQAIAAKTLTAVELVEASLARIAAREPTLQAWAYLDRELALKEARARDAEAPRGPLHGVPVGVKDIIDTAEMPTEHGSPMYKGNRPATDAACVALVKRAGGIILGKTVTTEFASSPPAKTRNPLNPEHSPGGSSSGSAAAVADFQVPIGFGTQTAGSVIRPSAYCGLVGFKPSYGAYAVSGVKLLAHSVDTLGTLTRSVDDALLMWEVLQAGPTAAAMVRERPRIGLCHTPFWGEAEKPAVDAFQTAGRRLAGAGFDLDIVELPSWFETLKEQHRVIAEYESARNTAFECAPERFHLHSPTMQAARERGWRLTPEKYSAARAAQHRGQQELEALIEGFDALMMPSAPGEAPEGLGTTGDPVFNRLASLLHVPTISLSVMKGPRGLPVGVQFVGPYGSDLGLLYLARRLEEVFA
jgi:amidase